MYLDIFFSSISGGFTSFLATDSEYEITLSWSVDEPTLTIKHLYLCTHYGVL